MPSTNQLNDNTNLNDISQNSDESSPKSQNNYAKVLSASTENVSLNTNSNFNSKSNPKNSNPSKKPNKPNYSDDDLNSPKKDQAIIIESAEGIKIIQYIEAIGNIIEPQNIIYASRLSKDRICMYLKSNEFVNKITENYDVITIDEINLTVRPLLLRATKYYLNKVCPSIPSSILHDTIYELGINITSRIQREKMSYAENEYSHILSFRRTFYGIPQKNVSIPDFFSLTFENENNRIYITSEIKRCDTCHKIGHLSGVCNLNKDNATTESQSIVKSHENQTNLININYDLCLSSSSLNEVEMTDISDNIHDNMQQTPMQLSNFPFTSSTHSSMQKHINTTSKSAKKTTPAEVANIDKLRQLYDEVIVSEISQSISFDYFYGFLTKMSKKEVNEDEIQILYSDQTKDMIFILESLRSVTKSATKARLTKTLYKMRNIFNHPSIASEINSLRKNNGA